MPALEEVGEAWEPEGFTPGAEPPKRRRWFTWKRIAAAIAVVLLVAAGVAYTEKDRFVAEGADLSRELIGDENTARVESWYFRVQDKVDQAKYRLLGGSTDPFATDRAIVTFTPVGKPVTVVYFIGKVTDTSANAPGDSSVAAPMDLPVVKPLRDDLSTGEGAWSTAGLPHTAPNDVLMAKTFVRPDKSRPYATVAMLLLDGRRIRVHMTAGTKDPGGYRGVAGPGTIPQGEVANLLVAFNGGFKGEHGGFGMVTDGKTYVPLRNGLATLCVLKSGVLKMGQYGDDITWDDSMVACRQNAVPLVRKGEISRRVGEGNDTWGYVEVNSAEFITWRSAVGLTKEGNLIIAAGNSLSAQTLASALWAAGAYTAMQLDINNPYVLTSLFFAQPDGSLRPQKLMDSMSDSPSRFLKTQERDFMWVTLDETRYQ